MTASLPLLIVKDIHKTYPGSQTWFKRRAETKAVMGVSFTLAAGETLGLVGESGCGKSTLSAILMGLIQPDQGQVMFDARNITDRNRRRDLELCRQMQIVFQDPYGSLNRRMTVKDIIAEPLKIHGLLKRAGQDGQISDLMEQVGLSPDLVNTYPAQLSGGQRQRVGIARALALSPRLLILDEPVSALDVSIQAQILNLLKKLQREQNMAYLFISHDLRVVRYMAPRIAVMYQGQIVETGDREQIFTAARHAYTRRLIAAIPRERYG
ncbi:ABC transporter ATP-binding protein (plasmid) [Rahnella aquatilis]|uniref:ABC transporter ATP-binding protein n=1 Tax=Rahnella perminowiae TaxID=2816244 RepID=A0ABS6KW74_9GAMM|nr:ATP-binding cassette domain-containing protein [Rahnella perminowiae]MBU9833578.1 ABC transporter ATP-binding protein [Rahnella perminowiae]UJD92362.1 ABC transporter ATP-binding protein [Rahnella aquatilis]